MHYCKITSNALGLLYSPRINTTSPLQDTTAIHMSVSTECPQTWNIRIVAGLVIGLGISVSPVAQLQTGHSLLLAAYMHMHHIGRWHSATCPHCNGADETAEHLVLHCPVHDQARQELRPNLHYQSDPRGLWSFLERIRVVTRPLIWNERGRAYIKKSVEMFELTECVLSTRRSTFQADGLA